MNNVNRIAFDESGNTGADLLNKEQPVFILASVNLTDEEARQLKNIFSHGADELKFSNLKKYVKYHDQIISLLNNELISENSVRFFMCHKEYSLIAHLVDRLIEPLLYDSNIDIYDNGLNLALTNMFFYCIPPHCDSNIYAKFKEDFILLFKKRDEESIERFYSSVEQLIASSKTEEFKSSLFPISHSRSIVKDALRKWDKYNFDSTLSGFIVLVDYWGRKTNERFNVIVDKSKPLTHFLHHIESLRAIELEQKEIGSDRRTLQIPLKINTVDFVDSKDHEVVQIADLIAGAANHYYRSLIDNKFADSLAEKIGQSKLINLFHSAVWPHQAFSPEDLGTVNTANQNNLLDELVKAVTGKNK